MNTLLILSPDPGFAESVRDALGAFPCRVIHRTTLEEAEPLLVHGLANACLVDVELRGVQDIWWLERLRQRAPNCPLIICAGEKRADWEEQAYLIGASQFIGKPIPAKAFGTILQRVFATRTATAPLSNPPRTVEPVTMTEPATGSVPPAANTLVLLRDFSRILTHSLNAEEMLRQFLLLLRQIVGVNRAVIFLRQPLTGLGSGSEREARRLHAAAAIGLSPGFLEHFQLSLDGGIGAQLQRLGRILRANAEETRADLETQKEFEILGARVAVPIAGREGLIGVAIFDTRVTGEPLVNAELELIFHLLEQVGLAVHNIWLHEQQVANHELLTDVLRELSSACLVVDRDLKILHANKMARKYFGQPARAGAEMDFADLPSELGSRIYQALRTGAALPPFRFEPAKPAGAIYNVTVVPFQRDKSGLPGSALMTIEDLTQSEQLRRLELEASDLRMVKNMAHRLVAETGNAIVPLNTFVQIPPDSIDKKLILSMLPALKDTDKRIERRVKQFRYLAEDAIDLTDQTTLGALLDKAYSDAQHYLPTKNAQLIHESGNAATQLICNRERLTHAFAEIFMNALQASPANPIITLRRASGFDPAETPIVGIEIHDNGSGFTAEAFEKVGRHFFTTRIPGLGLGLAVSRKIIESHGGRLEIAPPSQTDRGVVRVILPVTATAQGRP